MNDERPEILSTESLRDFVIAERDRKKWVFLATAYAPSQIMPRRDKRAVCDLFVIPSREVPLHEIETPAEIHKLNARFFCTERVGLTPRQAVWQLDWTPGIALPTLWRISHKTWGEMHVQEGEASNSYEEYSLYVASIGEDIKAIYVDSRVAFGYDWRLRGKATTSSPVWFPGRVHFYPNPKGIRDKRIVERLLSLEKTTIPGRSGS